MASTNDLIKPLKKRKAIEILEIVPTTSKPLVDLQEWIGSSVLARYGVGNVVVYRPGKITSCPSAGSVTVMLERDSEPTVYSNILNTLDILVNHPPAAVLVTPGLAVCVKEKADSSHFVVGKVKQICVGPPLRCLIKSDSLREQHWVNRANLRLMQPPWQDDLRETSVTVDQVRHFEGLIV